MPPYTWTFDPIPIIVGFETKHKCPQAGGLLQFAHSAASALYYLGDLDSTHDLTAQAILGYSPDIVEVAHARWATGTCITSLDLGAAALGRALGKTKGKFEPSIAHFTSGKEMLKRRAKLPANALAWIDGVADDVDYQNVKDMRDALTHARVRRHFRVPRQRLEVQGDKIRLDVPALISLSAAVSTKHVKLLFDLVPSL